MNGGIFTTMLVRDGEPWWWTEHGARLAEGAAALGLPAPALDALRDEWNGRVGAGDWRVRVTLLPGRAPLVEAEPYVRPSRPWRLRPVAVDHARDLVRLKTTERGPYEEAARRAGDADDVLLVAADGALLECTIANVFLRIDGRWWTPPATLPLLTGIVRARLLAAGATERRLEAADARRATACVVTNALLPVHPVAGIDGIGEFDSGAAAHELAAVLAGPDRPSSRESV